MTLAITSDVLQRPALAPAVQPEGEDSLIRLAELARPSQHATAVDAHWEPKASPYSRAIASDASLVAPYRETGAAVEKTSVMPASLTPGGVKTASAEGSNAPSRTSTGSWARGGIEYTRLVESSTKPAPQRLQASSICTVPSRLCSTSWRLLALPSTPPAHWGWRRHRSANPAVPALQDQQPGGCRHAAHGCRAAPTARCCASCRAG